MAFVQKTARTRRKAVEQMMLNGAAGAATAVLGLLALTFPAQGPAHGEAAIPALAQNSALASIDFLGSAPVITGSVNHLFDTGGFRGPNRLAKTDRARYVPDVMEMASSFSDIRERILVARAAAIETTRVAALPGSAARPEPITPAATAERVAIAAVSPRAVSQALDAIDGITGSTAPLPVAPPQQIAYARAEAPATEFGLKDKAGTEVSDKELWCLATAIYFEARGEAYRGQIGVAQVVLNRVKHSLYPSTICSVVFQNQHMRNACQFSFACDGIPEKVTDQKSWKQAEEIARGTVKGDLYLAEVGAATHYHATYVKPRWAPRMQKLTQIGLHVFYQFKRGWRFG
ncbi:Cell wall hydrolase CwlJ, involved in spore germination [Devosia enhydra]|uniref:Cell wall hydrolase CwlJ, involved in spore germination n=1 Tax=Devosia enhydra TaxID=665118 RepID=A0A1K2I1E5_9HYPH|nr:cell wall hydrolase [Devosia enhydra]SFZ86079.1 Cell wall hydrolase CwlJ, involved in spore germination [Devosia enhydra]